MWSTNIAVVLLKKSNEHRLYDKQPIRHTAVDRILATIKLLCLSCRFLAFLPLLLNIPYTFTVCVQCWIFHVIFDLKRRKKDLPCIHLFMAAHHINFLLLDLCYIPFWLSPSASHSQKGFYVSIQGWMKGFLYVCVCRMSSLVWPPTCILGVLTSNATVSNGYVTLL